MYAPTCLQATATAQDSLGTSAHTVASTLKGSKKTTRQQREQIENVPRKRATPVVYQIDKLACVIRFLLPRIIAHPFQLSFTCIPSTPRQHRNHHPILTTHRYNPPSKTHLAVWTGAHGNPRSARRARSTRGRGGFGGSSRSSRIVVGVRGGVHCLV